jgi:O-antigen/teichoic acid export membrane protein
MIKAGITSYFLKNGSWVFLRQVVETASGLALSVVFARLSTQEVYGQYQFILSIFATISILSIPGFNTSIIKAAAKGYDGEYKEAVKKSFLWSLIGVPVLLAVGAFYYFQNPTLGVALMIASIFFPFFYAPNTWDIFLRGKEEFKTLALYGSVQALINAIVTILVLILDRNNLLAIIVTYLISYTFFNILYYRKSLKFVKNDKRDGEAISFGFFLTKLSIIGTIANNIDRLLIGIFLSPASLAIYSVGILFTKQIQGISKNLLWIISVKDLNKKILTRQSYVKVFVVSSLITIICLLGFRYIIPFLFSQKYSEAIFLSEISIIFYPFFVIFLLYGNEVTFNNEKRVLALNSFISPIVFILLDILVLPLWGIKGLAFLSGFQYAIYTLVVYLLRRSGRRASVGK